MEHINHATQCNYTIYHPYLRINNVSIKNHLLFNHKLSFNNSQYRVDKIYKKSSKSKKISKQEYHIFLTNENIRIKLIMLNMFVRKC